MRRHRRLLLCLCILCIACLCVWSFVFANERAQTLTVAFLSVGQGDAIFIEAPNGVQVLVDGGPDASVLRELSHVMEPWDYTIDVILATHPDADHIEGFIDVLEKFDVSLLVLSGAEKDTGIYETFSALVGKEKIEGATVIDARRGHRLVLDKQAGVFLEILFPDHDLQALADANEGSILARLVYGESEFLFTGDSPQIIEEYVAGIGPSFVAADVLKVGHHGSKTSTSEYFLAAVNPTFAVISAGKDNPHGHPHEEVLHTLATQHIETLTTFENGTIIFESNGKSIQRVD